MIIISELFQTIVLQKKIRDPAATSSIECYTFEGNRHKKDIKDCHSR